MPTTQNSDMITKEIIENIFPEVENEELEFIMEMAYTRSFTDSFPIKQKGNYKFSLDIYINHIRIKQKDCGCLPSLEIIIYSATKEKAVEILKHSNELPLRDLALIFDKFPGIDKTKYGIYSYKDLKDIKNSVIRNKLTRVPNK